MLSKPWPPFRPANFRSGAVSPLVLVVHGREGGVIPAALRELAADLERRRGAPVLLQALTGAPPEPSDRFWRAAGEAGAFFLVPLLLLPGGHVRRDLPALVAFWRRRAGPGAALRRLPFLGAWPPWQLALASLLVEARCQVSSALAARPVLALWLHHPLEGALCQRHLRVMEVLLAAPGVAASYSEKPPFRPAGCGEGLVVLPLTLAASRLSESLAPVLHRQPCDRAEGHTLVLPPLLEIPALRQFLLSALEALP